MYNARMVGGSADNDRERFEALAMPLARPLYGFALRLTQRSDDAADLVQETFLRAYRTFASFRPGTNAKAWMFKILYSIHVNVALRRGRRPATTSMDNAYEDGPMEIADWSGTAEILTNPAIDWEGSEVEREVSALPEEFREAVLLVDLGDLTYEEAAKVAGCPVGTIRSRLARARRRLAERLRDVARSRGLVKE
jgi:RNA polymerase sigma-70 factor (ECF subfamily)